MSVLLGFLFGLLGDILFGLFGGTLLDIWIFMIIFWSILEAEIWISAKMCMI